MEEIFIGNDWLEDIFDERQIITIPNRVQNVSTFCKSLNIKKTIFNAILKNDLTYNNVYKLKIGEIACALSQEQVLKNFIATNKNSLLMFEDDIMPITHTVYTNSGIKLEDIKKYILKCVKHLPVDWDVVYLGRCWDNCKKHVKINDYIVRVNHTLCHHAIAFSKIGAKKIVDNIIHPMSTPIDHIVANLCTKGIIDCYATTIPIFYQNRDELSTTIGNFDALPICV